MLHSLEKLLYKRDLNRRPVASLVFFEDNSLRGLLRNPKNRKDIVPYELNLSGENDTNKEELNHIPSLANAMVFVSIPEQFIKFGILSINNFPRKFTDLKKFIEWRAANVFSCDLNEYEINFENPLSSEDKEIFIHGINSNLLKNIKNRIVGAGGELVSVRPQSSYFIEKIQNVVRTDSLSMLIYFGDAGWTIVVFKVNKVVKFIRSKAWPNKSFNEYLEFLKSDLEMILNHFKESNSAISQRLFYLEEGAKINFADNLNELMDELDCNAVEYKPPTLNENVCPSSLYAFP